MREPQRRERLWNNARYLREGLEALGFDTGPGSTPIVPVIVNSEERALRMWRGLFERGVFTSPVFHPAVPPGTALIRTSCMATHTTAQLERVLEAFEQSGRELGLIEG